jgi:hypothetical protein
MVAQAPTFEPHFMLGRGFPARTLLLLILMLVVAAGEYLFGGKDGSSSAVAWLYGIAIYAICLVMHDRGAAAEAKTSRAIAAVLVVAALHSVHDLVSELRSGSGYEVPKLGRSSWLSLAVAIVGAGLLARFRSSANPVVRAAWTIALVDIVLAVETIVITGGLQAVGSTGLAIGSDLFDIGVTLAAAVAIYRTVQPPTTSA